MNESDASSVIRQQQGVRHFVDCRVLVDAGLSVFVILFPRPRFYLRLFGRLAYVGAVSFVISTCVHLRSLIHRNFICIKTKEALRRYVLHQCLVPVLIILHS